MKCSKHPTYKVIREPTADCEACHLMWDAKRTMLSEHKRLDYVDITEELAHRIKIVLGFNCSKLNQKFYDNRIPYQLQWEQYNISYVFHRGVGYVKTIEERP